MLTGVLRPVRTRGAVRLWGDAAACRDRSDTIPDESTRCTFRHLLERRRLTEAIFATISRYLSERGLVMRQGTLVDATILHALSSTKNQSKRRDPDMSQTKRGNPWYFGMKAYIGVDLASGLAHSVVGTTANAADSSQLDKLLHCEEERVLGDGGYPRSDRTLSMHRCHGKDRDHHAVQGTPPGYAGVIARQGGTPVSGYQTAIRLYHGTLPAAWPRTPPDSILCLPWPICSWYDDPCWLTQDRCLG